MISSDGASFTVEGELAQAVAAVADDGLSASPFRLTTADGASAVVISEELLLILMRAGDQLAEHGPPLTIEELTALVNQPSGPPAAGDG
ncbi:hypothetical protein GCM10010156_49130 [Planobispora rosea]|uniref:Uncharacterized protein n=1 Tax=Planobispora rosea TaxID=35762 RepID=A0A8J3S7K9_PLARO|nr:hypothetical protein [Planobispora rosea]GGS84664.1 hypothetical protein GCM10010156_49130 [Planobispora rosea]GIH86424.1 hypothetical protein Pro02_48320 [Planobispora rosea]